MALFGATPAAPVTAAPTNPLGAIGGFLWGDNGQPLTPQQAAANQEVASAMMMQAPVPHTLGEGMSAVARAMIARDMRDKGYAAQSAGMQKANADFSGVEADPSKAMDFLANDLFANDGQKAVAQALMQQRNPQIQAQIANLNADTGVKISQANMFANGGPATGTVIFDKMGNPFIATQYGTAMRPLSAPGQAAPVAAPPDTPAANGGAIPVPASVGAATGAPNTGALTDAHSAASTGGYGVFPTQTELAGANAAATKTGEIKAALPQQMVAAKNSLDQLDQSDKLVSSFIDQAINEASGMGATGWIGKLSEAVPGTPAYKLARTLDTVKSNVGFDKLQAMRAASPSGGALGQVSNFEEQLLQAVLGSLDQGQDAPTIIANLQRLKGFTASNSAQRHAAFHADFGDVKPLSGDPTFNPAVTGAAPVKISGDADFAALPSGARFIGPDGRLRTKP